MKWLLTIMILVISILVNRGQKCHIEVGIVPNLAFWLFELSISWFCPFSKQVIFLGWILGILLDYLFIFKKRKKKKNLTILPKSTKPLSWLLTGQTLNDLAPFAGISREASQLILDLLRSPNSLHKFQIKWYYLIPISQFWIYEQRKFNKLEGNCKMKQFSNLFLFHFQLSWVIDVGILFHTNNYLVNFRLQIINGKVIF